MLWTEELKTIDQLSAKISNLGSDVSKVITQMESRKATLENEIVKLESDYDLLKSRNEETRKQFQKNSRLDLEKLQNDQLRVKTREIQLIEKEKELRKMMADAEVMINSAKQGRTKHV